MGPAVLLQLTARDAVGAVSKPFVGSNSGANAMEVSESARISNFESDQVSRAASRDKEIIC